MPYEVGTAVGYLDLLQKLKAFLTGTNSPTSGLSWVVEEERSTFTSPESVIADGDGAVDVQSRNNVDHHQIIFRGNGGTSPEKEIYFGIQTMGDTNVGYANWQIRGFTGFATSSPQYVDFLGQPGKSPPVYLPLQFSPAVMEYWFIANNRHVKGVVKTGSSYQNFYIGFINPYALESEYPYPMYVGATAQSESIIFSSNALHLHGILSPGSSDNSKSVPTPGDSFPTLRATSYLRWVDGVWYGCKNWVGTSTEGSFGTGEPDAENFSTYPFAPYENVEDENEQLVNPERHGNKGDAWYDTGSGIGFKDTAPGGTPHNQQFRAYGSPEQTNLWPLTLFNQGQGNIAGDLDGVYWAPGAGGLTSEDTFTDSGESPEVVYTAFQSAWRTDSWSYLAMRMD